MGRVLHSSYSGFMPDCIPVASVGPTTNYPVGLSLENLMKIYWVVDGLQINYQDISITQFSMGQFSSSSSLFPDVEPPVIWAKLPFQDEQSHVCLDRPWIFVSGPPDYDPNSGLIDTAPFEYVTWIASVPATSQTFSLRMFAWESAFMVVKNGGLFYPHFLLRIQKFSAPSFLVTTRAGAGLTATHTLNFFNIASVPLYTLNSQSNRGTNVDLIAKTYWEYRDSDGKNPIWDRITGERIG